MSETPSVYLTPRHERNMSSNQESNYLGFGNLPSQVHRKSVKKGFEFTLMVVGESGLGKSTLISCLFGNNLYANRKLPKVTDQLESTVKITATTADIEERGVKLKLTVVDTPGYGDSLDLTESVDPIVNYIDEQYEKFLQHESGLNRRHIADSRVHCCFFFISPFNYGLRPDEIQFMKMMHDKVNLIPVIAKADALTKNEVNALKKRIMTEIKANNIHVYSIPECDSDEDDEFKEQVRQIKAAFPFAISSSLQTHDIKGRTVRGRLYPWGVVETDNPDHSDFVKLRSMLVTHMQDLREVTQDLHYENYRSHRLQNNPSGKSSAIDIASDARSDVSQDESEKDRILKEKEAELKRMQEMLAQMQEQMKQQHLAPASNGAANGTANGNTANGN